MKKHTLFLDSPAGEWEMGTPIGNGFCGAMIYGRTDREVIQLTEESIWSGGKINIDDPTFRDKIDRVRALFLAGKEVEASEYAEKALENAFQEVEDQETAGNIILLFKNSENITSYRRELDMRRGIATVSYEQNGERLVRESFASYPDRVICTRISGSHSFTLRYEHPETWVDVYWDTWTSEYVEFEDVRFNVDDVTVEGDTLIAHAHPVVGGKPFEVRVQVKTNGSLRQEGEDIVVEEATLTDLYMTVAVDKAAVLPTAAYEDIRERHIADFSCLMDRSALSLGADPLAEVSIDKRFERLKTASALTDPALVALYFDFGKYLLISSSRPGSYPANLQGVWNPYTRTPWNGDYHTNINLQMNYWHAETANIPQCTQPLFDYMNEVLLPSGKETAEKRYRCRGTVVHHLADIYGFTSTADGLMWGLWPLGGAWLCHSMWEHYLFSGDKTFLQETAYDFIHESVRFFLDYMFEDEQGRLLSGPSISPENTYIVDGKNINICISPTMDIEIIGTLFRLYLEMESILGLDSAQAEETEVALTKLPPLQIGEHGRLLEWMKDYEEAEPGHRHISHLFALYPDCSISRETPQLLEAAKRTLERRLACGGGHTGWSCAWLISLFARMGDAEQAVSMLYKLFTESTRGSMLDSHPPFQIDGNFGATAAIVEMLLQSHNHKIELLPACPAEFSEGEFKHFRARGGYLVSASWAKGKLSAFEIEAENQAEVTVCYESSVWNMTLQAGEKHRVEIKENTQ